MSKVFTDVVEDVQFESFTDDKGREFLQVSGVAKRADHINKNRRYYSSEVLRKAVDEAQNLVNNGSLVGLIRHPDPWAGEPSKGHVQMTAIKWTDLTMEGKDVKVKGVVVKTAAGSDLQALIDAKVKVGLSTNMKGAVKYVKAKDLDKSYPDQDAAIQVFDIAEFNTIDVVNNPADHFAALDSIEKEFANMTLAELKKNSPDLYKDLLAEAVVVASADKSDDAETDQIIIQLRKENEELKDQITKSSRASMVTDALSEAKLPKLGVQGKLDLDARFRARLESVAFSADSDEKAQEAVQDLIAEQKALLGVGGDPNKDSEDNNPGIKRRDDDKNKEVKRPVVKSVRTSLGL